MNFSQSKQLDRIVETLALSALLATKEYMEVKGELSSPRTTRKKIEERLIQIAFPLEIELDNSIVLQEHERIVTCAELDDLYSKGYKAGTEANTDL